MSIIAALIPRSVAESGKRMSVLAQQLHIVTNLLRQKVAAAENSSRVRIIAHSAPSRKDIGDGEEIAIACEEILFSIFAFR
jgi:hypothetical protein